MLDIFNKQQLTALQQELAQCRRELVETVETASKAIGESTEELIAANLKVAQLKLELACADQAPVKPTWHLNSAGTAVVSDTFKFLPVDGKTPKGAKMTLLGPGGAAVISVYNGENFWKGWAPLPGTDDSAPKPGV